MDWFFKVIVDIFDFEVIILVKTCVLLIKDLFIDLI